MSTVTFPQSIAWMKLFMDPFQVIDGDPGVNLGRFQGLMPQQLLDVPHRSTVFHHVSGAGMPERVRTDIFLDAGSLGMPFHNRPNSVRPHPVTEPVQYEMPAIFQCNTLGPDYLNVICNQVTHPLANRNYALPVTFSVNVDVTAFKIHVFNLNSA